MKRFIALCMVLLLGISLCACGKDSTTSGVADEMLNYVGKWVKEPYTNQDTGIVYYHVLYLYEDGTGKDTTTSSEGVSYAEHGTWYIEEGRIVLDITFASGDFTSATKSFLFDENGYLKGSQYRSFYEITGAYTIKDYTKEE